MEPFIGMMVMFAGNFAPRGWALCDGQLLSISEHSALFSILGTTYGGDGRTTFGLPDLRGRMSVHQGNGPGLPRVVLGEKGGLPTTTLTTQNLAAHSHAIDNQLRIGCYSDEGSAEDNPENNTLGPFEGPYVSEAPDADMNSGAIRGTISNANTGSNTPFSNMSPFTGVNYIIALVGTFPSRN